MESRVTFNRTVDFDALFRNAFSANLICGTYNSGAGAGILSTRWDAIGTDRVKLLISDLEFQDIVRLSATHWIEIGLGNVAERLRNHNPHALQL